MFHFFTIFTSTEGDTIVSGNFFINLLTSYQILSESITKGFGSYPCFRKAFLIPFLHSYFPHSLTSSLSKTAPFSKHHLVSAALSPHNSNEIFLGSTLNISRILISSEHQTLLIRSSVSTKFSSSSISKKLRTSLIFSSSSSSR